MTARIFIVVTFREGKIFRYRELYDEAAALKAAGLSEWAVSRKTRRIRGAYSFRSIQGDSRCSAETELAQRLVAERLP